MKSADRYGDAKFSCEEALANQRDDEGGFPWVTLRFADVIGPRDTTDRWYFYQLWVKFYESIGRPMYIPTHVLELKQSMTYVNDAAQAVITAFEKGPAVWDEAYNIAMEEEFTLWDTVQSIAKVLGKFCIFDPRDRL